MEVSVIMVTYNHEKYISEAIEGVLAQGCDLELIIGDDCSPDNTAEIVNHYISNHPEGHRIRYHRHPRNVGMMPNFIYTLNQAKGKYIALCDGDDYWTDPNKLQKQVAFLEENQDFSLVAHNIQAENETGLVSVKKEQSEYTIHDFLESSILNTVSVVFRRSVAFPAWIADAPFGDWAIFVHCAQQGRIGVLPEEMAVYRMHGNGFWTALNNRNQHQRVIEFLEFIKDRIPAYSDILTQKIDLKKKYYGLYDYSLKGLIKGEISFGTFMYGIRTQLNLRNRISKLLRK